MEKENCDFSQMPIEKLPTQALFQQVTHMHRQYAALLLKDSQLKPGQAGILFVLEHRGELSQRELAERIFVKPPSVTVALQKMEKQGYISKRQDEKDQRITRIRITDKGHEYVQDVWDMMEKVEETLFQGMTAEEVMLFRRLLMQMRENLMNTEEMSDKTMCFHQKKYNDFRKDN